MPYNKRRWSLDPHGLIPREPHEADYVIEETVTDDDKTVLWQQITGYKRKGPKGKMFKDENGVLWLVYNNQERTSFLSLQERHGKEVDALDAANKQV